MLKNVLITSVLGSLAFGAFAFGATLDTANAKTTWTAYKFYDKTPVRGTFSKISYQWGKDTKSIEGMLTGATAVIDGMSVDLGDERSATVAEGFFSQFKNKEIRVRFTGITPDSTDKNKGRIEGVIEMNGVAKPVPIWLPYTIEQKTFVANGVIDLNDFALGSALAKLHEICGELHGGKTWSEAGISLEIPLK